MNRVWAKNKDSERIYGILVMQIVSLAALRYSASAHCDFAVTSDETEWTRAPHCSRLSSSRDGFLGNLPKYHCEHRFLCLPRFNYVWLFGLPLFCCLTLLHLCTWYIRDLIMRILLLQTAYAQDGNASADIVKHVADPNIASSMELYSHLMRIRQKIEMSTHTAPPPMVWKVPHILEHENAFMRKVRIWVQDVADVDITCDMGVGVLYHAKGWTRSLLIPFLTSVYTDFWNCTLLRILHRSVGCCNLWRSSSTVFFGV